MSWGYKITLLYTSFALFMFGMVFACIKYNKIHLVTKDYYAQEVNYDQKVEKIRNTNSLDQKVKIMYDIQAQYLKISFPDLEEIKGSIQLYRPANSKADQKFDIKLENNRQAIDVSALSRGQWKVLLDWESEGKPFYQDQLIIL